MLAAGATLSVIAMALIAARRPQQSLPPAPVQLPPPIPPPRPAMNPYVQLGQGIQSLQSTSAARHQSLEAAVQKIDERTRTLTSAIDDLRDAVDYLGTRGPQASLPAAPVDSDWDDEDDEW